MANNVVSYRKFMDDCVNARHLTPDDKTRTVYIGRGGPWGNPFPISKTETRSKVLWKFLKYVHEMPDDSRKAWLAPLVGPLRNGWKLRCFCAPYDCHGMILAGYTRKIFGLHPFEGQTRALRE